MGIAEWIPWQRAAPAGRSVRHRLLIGLFVRLGVELHRRIRRRHELFDKDAKLDLPVVLNLGQGKLMIKRELLRLTRVGELPFQQAGLAKRESR